MKIAVETDDDNKYNAGYLINGEPEEFESVQSGSEYAESLREKIADLSAVLTICNWPSEEKNRLNREIQELRVALAEVDILMAS